MAVGSGTDVRRDRLSEQSDQELLRDYLKLYKGGLMEKTENKQPETVEVPKQAVSQAISLAEVLQFREERFAASMDLIAKKGHDYNREQQNSGDTLFNLRVCELLGIVETSEQGILTRLSDKFMRLISLTKVKGIEAQVTDESVFVTIDDLHNYVDYLGLMWARRNGRR